jgi:molybdopterin-guanine dinucleotide biosynthesis protein A
MGGCDKALVPFAASTLLGHVLARLQQQRVDPILLSANGDVQRFGAFGLPVVADTVPDNPGPLAGLLAGMEWLQTHAPDTTDLVTVPTDTPFVPTDLVARLIEGRGGAEIACAASGGRVQPVCAIWPVRLAPLLREVLTQEKLRRVDRWTARFAFVEVAFSVEPVDPFLNVNTPEELAGAEAMFNSCARTTVPAPASSRHLPR